MRRSLAVAALALAIPLAVPAAAAPKADPRECPGYTDVALVARALAMDDIDAPRSARILARIYDTQGDARVEDIVRAIVAAAQRDKSAAAGEFARRLARACVYGAGDMDAVLGTGA